MSTEFLQTVKDKLRDLPEAYINMVDENFRKYVDYRMEQGQSMVRIMNGLGDPDEIAQRFEFFYKIHQIHGRRHQKGAAPLIKEALNKGVLPRQTYNNHKTKMIVISIFMLILGAVLTVLGSAFLIANLDNPWGLNMSVITLSVSIFMGGIGCFCYISILRFKFQNEMLSASLDGCNLQYFGT